jgi:effector-binding domain-containing protein
MRYEINTCTSAPQLIVSIRECHPVADLPAYIGRTFAQLFGRLEVFGVAPTGVPMVIYHEFGPDGVDAEVGVPVAHDLSTLGEVQTRVLPASRVARTLHVGPYEELEAAYAALMAWIPEHEFEVAGPIQERYLNAPGDQVPPSAYQTEIEIPIVPRHAAVAGPA